MTTTTFGYSATQDRLWMRVHQQDSTVWLTRRMVTCITGPLLKAFEAATPGQQGGASARARAGIEHSLALHESVPGQPVPQIRAGRESPGEKSDPQQQLCTRITSQTTGQAVTITFDTAAGPLVLRLSRQGMHMWFQGLSMVLKQARWDLPEALPDWLQAGVMPPALQAMMRKPLPDLSQDD